MRRSYLPSYLRTYLKDLLQWHQPIRTLCSSSEQLLQVPKPRLKGYHGDTAFGAAAPRMWNTPPNSMTKSVSKFEAQFENSPLRDSILSLMFFNVL